MKKTALSLAINAALISTYSVTAIAQEQTDVSRQQIQSSITETNAQPSTGKNVEKITVTGSRLKRRNFNIVTPMVSINKDDIADAGVNSLSEILVDEIPGISESLSDTNTQSSIQGTGLSTVNLRKLGSNRTLVLIDGKRTVSNSASSNSVSLSSIPSAMVDNVEVITGGSSATYGSDAIAGVVNIITKQSSEGFKFKTKAGEATKGGNKEFELDLGYGSEFADGKGYAYFAATWDRNFGLDWSDRRRAQIEADYDYNYSKFCNEMNTIDGDQCMRDITQADWVARDDEIPGGIFEDGDFFYDANGLQTDYDRNIHGFNDDVFVKLKVPKDKVSTAFKVDYDLTDDIVGRFQIHYNLAESYNNKIAETVEYNDEYLIFEQGNIIPGEIEAGRIPKDNPYVPAVIAEQASSKGIKWERRLDEVGNIATDNERETIRTWLGFEGTIFDGEWDWDVSLGYGRFEQNQTRFNEIDITKLQQALDAELAADGTTIQCADADARAAGCAPINLFGIGTVSTEAADWIRSNPTITNELEQINLVGYMAGDLFSLPAGEVAAVIGVEYRKDKQKISVSKEQELGGISFNVVPGYSADIDVKEVFGEVAMPLLSDAPLAKSLTMEASLRLADYSLDNIDLMSSYKVGFIWEPAEGYLFRANYARAQRAPSISEAFSPPRGDFDSFDDPCDELTLTSSDPGHAACRLDANVLAALNAGLAEGPNFEFEDDNNGYSPNAGNTNLKEETADTYTLGLSIAPSFIDNFNLSIDYYSIEIDDAIGQVSNRDILRQCYKDSNSSLVDNSFCNDITRNEEGQIIQLLQRLQNLAQEKATGYDIAARYDYDLEDYGKLTFKLNYNHVIERSETFVGEDNELITNRFEGELDSGVFEDKARMSLRWKIDDWSLRWAVSYLGSVVDSHDRVADFEDALLERQEIITAGSQPSASAEQIAAANEQLAITPETPRYLYLGSYFRHDFSLSRSFELNDTDIKLSAGVKNVFDNLGPFLPGKGDVDASARGNSSGKYGAGVGRFVYIGAEIKF